MGSNFEIVRKLIASDEELPQEAKSDLTHLFSQARDEELEEVARLLTEYLEWIMHVAENYKVKMEALHNQDAMLWEWIMKKEVEQVKQFQHTTTS